MVGDYLITVEPVVPYGESYLTERLTNVTADHVEGYVNALKKVYSDYNKYQINFIKL